MRGEGFGLAKKIDYAAMFTMRSDGRYQGYWHEPDEYGLPRGKRHAICDKDPGRLYEKILDKEANRTVTLAAAADAWEKDYRQTVSDRTWKNMKPHKDGIVARHGKVPIAKITALEVNRDLLAAKSRGLSRTVVNTRRVIWNGIFTYAVAHGDAPFNPVLSVKLPGGLPHGKRSAPDDDMVKAILADSQDMDFGFIPFFLLCTGCRRNEALQRLKSDVDTEAWELHIQKSKTAAGVRTVPIIEPLRGLLRVWMATHSGKWLFPHLDYYAGRKKAVGYMSDSNWDTAWAAYCARHGWIDGDGKPTIGAHNLRHGTATLLFEAGVDVYTAQHILGHAQVSTTMAIYTELREKQKQKNIEKFGDSMAELMAEKKKAME